MRKKENYYNYWKTKVNKMPGLLAILNTVAIIIIVIMIGYMNRLKYEERDAYLPALTGTISSVQTDTSSNGSIVDIINTHYTQSDAAAWNLVLVNDWNDLSNINQSWLIHTKYGRFDKRAADSLSQMMIDGKNYGLKVVKAFANDPSDMEHITGLAVDITSEGIQTSEEFERTNAYTWLFNHCANYGFILRYIEGKEHITGQIYSAMHFRYIGEESARLIMSRGLTLEEYLEIIGS